MRHAHPPVCQTFGSRSFRKDSPFPLRPQEWRARGAGLLGYTGGGVEDGETFEQAAIRELEEETGIRVRDIGLEVGRREFVLQLHNGERVMADERFFLVKLTAASLSRDGWTAQEVEVMADHRWWSLDELAQTSATIWPENLLAMLNTAKAR